MTIERSLDDRAGTALRAALVIGAVWLLGACDPPTPADVLVPPAATAQFAVAGTTIRDSVLPQGEDLVIRFTRPIDAAAFGPRSLTVTMPRRRRITGTSVSVERDALRVPADMFRTLAPGDVAELRVEGGASPCAVRSADGTPLAERLLLAFRLDPSGPPDLAGPVVVSTRPADGAADVAPGVVAEIRFSEPVSEAAALDAITLTADGAAVPARVRASPDRRRVLVRPSRPLPAGSYVEIDVHRSLSDTAGNLLDRSSPGRFGFRVRRSHTDEVEEDFASDEFADRSATDCAWGDPDAPGLLVARCGAIPLPCLSEDPTTDLGDRDEIRFQILVRSDETMGGLGSGLRLRLSSVVSGAVDAVRVDAGPIDDDILDPWFQGNRDRARLEVVADETGPLEWDPDWLDGATVDVPFVQPLPIEAGVPLLLDVTVRMAPGARLAALPDIHGRALVRDAPREPLLPAAALLVAGADPVARSLWYDAGSGHVAWRSAGIELEDVLVGARVVAEFQTAPGDAEGRPDVSLASPWAADLGGTPAGRFVRFRVRFDGSSRDGRTPRLERVVMPYDRR